MLVVLGAFCIWLYLLKSGKFSAIIPLNKLLPPFLSLLFLDSYTVYVCLLDGQLVVGFRLERAGFQQFGFQAREAGVQHFGKHFTFIRLYCAVRGGDKNIDY